MPPSWHEEFLENIPILRQNYWHRANFHFFCNKHKELKITQEQELHDLLNETLVGKLRGGFNSIFIRRCLSTMPFVYSACDFICRLSCFVNRINFCRVFPTAIWTAGFAFVQRFTEKRKKRFFLARVAITDDRRLNIGHFLFVFWNLFLLGVGKHAVVRRPFRRSTVHLASGRDTLTVFRNSHRRRRTNTRQELLVASDNQWTKI